MRRPSVRQTRGEARRRVGAAGLGVACVLGLVACSGDDGGPPELTWYINPDAGGQAAVAEACSTDDYTITTQVLPRTPTSSGSSWPGGSRRVTPRSTS